MVIRESAEAEEIQQVTATSSGPASLAGSFWERLKEKDPTTQPREEGGVTTTESAGRERLLGEGQEESRLPGLCEGSEPAASGRAEGLLVPPVRVVHGAIVLGWEEDAFSLGFGTFICSVSFGTGRKVLSRRVFFGPGRREFTSHSFSVCFC